MEGCSDKLQECPEALNITFREISYSLPATGGKPREILHGVSGQILSGRLTALLGPSGAGKTSLLNVLSGFKNKGVRGSVLVNGVEREIDEFRTQARYITQDVALLGKLTTLETLVMAAKLKLTTPYEEQSRVVTNIIDLLALGKARDTFVQNLSGGEKKRLSIGVELITNPPIMFFDEPTSGLDSVSSAQIMLHLRSLASAGRTIVCVIHQPNSRIYNLFDDMILLGDGQVLYCGSISQMVPVFEEAGFTCPQYYNRADFALEVACMEKGHDLCLLLEKFKLPPETTFENGDIELLNGKLEENVIGIDALSRNAVKVFKEKKRKYANSQARQFNILLQRTMKCTIRDLFMCQVRLASHIIIGLTLGVLYYNIGNDAAKVNSNVACLFFFIMFLYFGSAMPTIVTFPSEMNVLVREHLNNWYSLPPYLFAKCLANLPLQMLCPLSFLVMSYWLTGQPNDLTRFFMTLLTCNLLVITSQGISMSIGAACDNVLGVFIVPVIAIPMMLFSGFFQRLQDIPVYFKWLSHLSPFKNSFEALSVAVYGMNRPKLDCSEAFCFFRLGDKFLDHMGMSEDNYWSDIIALVVWSLLTHGMLYAVVKWKISTFK